MKNKIIEILKMNRYLLFSIILFFAGLIYFFGEKTESNLTFSKNEKQKCDTTKIPKYSLFDLANMLNNTINYSTDSAKIVLLITDSQGIKNRFSYQKVDNLFLKATVDESNFTNLTLSDSIAFKALISPNSKIYERWWPIIEPFRHDFVKKRTELFNQLPAELPNYKFIVISDFRKTDSQEKLLKTGKSTSPLSAHQFGLASDIAIKRKGRYLTGHTFYKIMGKKSIEQGLTWGGNFVGFVDTGHIQLFENSAKMLAEMPTLSYEFEPFRNYYESRIKIMELAGKEKSIEDTKQLLQMMDFLNDGKICACQLSEGISTNNNKAEQLKPIDYQQDKDYLILLNETEREATIYQPKENVVKFKLGTFN